MLQAEKKNGGQPLEELLPKLMNNHGLSGTAEKLGVSKATLNYWLLKFEIKIHKIALAPGQSVVIQNLPPGINPYAAQAYPQNVPPGYPPGVGGTFT